MATRSIPMVGGARYSLTEILLFVVVAVAYWNAVSVTVMAYFRHPELHLRLMSVFIAEQGGLLLAVLILGACRRTPGEQVRRMAFAGLVVAVFAFAAAERSISPLMR